MHKRRPFSDTLKYYVKRSNYTPGQLAHLCDIPKNTLVNWLKGRVRRPRNWQDLFRLATVLHLDRAETTALLQSAGYPSPDVLSGQATDVRDRNLLVAWKKSTGSRKSPPPFQVIADLPYFVGRKEELEALEKALINNSRVALFSLQGMGGVGKTALAARLAYRMRPYFTDGVLWARVDTSDTMAILSTFAQAYGRDVSALNDLESRSRVVRELLADKRALIVLDNAQESAQVQPLIPPSGNCTVLVTTRRHDLAVARGAYRFVVGPFSREKAEAHALFRKLLGEEAAAHEKEALAEIADLLGHLPLALSIVASRMAYEPSWSAESFLARLRQEQRRLNELAFETHGVRLSFNLGYAALTPDERQAFAVLGLFGGEDFAPEPVAYVLGIDRMTAEDLLRALYAVSLAQLGRPGRYRLHPLLRDYARECLHGSARECLHGSARECLHGSARECLHGSARENAPDVGEEMGYAQAVRRLVAFYTAYAEEHQRHYDLLQLEAGNLLAALDLALDERSAEYHARMIEALTPFLEIQGLYGPAELHLGRAAEAAEASGDVAGQVAALCSLGKVAREQSDLARAESYLQKGLALAYAIEDPRSVSLVLQGLGTVTCDRGEYAEAEGHYRESLALAREAGDAARIPHLLLDLGSVLSRRGNYDRAEGYYKEGLPRARDLGQDEIASILLQDLGVLAGLRGDNAQAVVYLEEGLAVARRIDYRKGICQSLINLGCIAYDDAAYAEAESYLLEGLALSRELERRVDVVFALENLGCLAMHTGAGAEAEAYFAESLTLAQEIESAWDVVAIRYSWGELHLKRRQWAEAQQRFRQVVKEAREIGAREKEGEALFGLARVALAREEAAEARRLAEQALAIFGEIGHGKAAEVEGWLAELSEK